MTNPLIQSLFSDTTLGVLNIAVKGFLPDKYDWIADIAQIALSSVDDLDALDVEGPAKTSAIVTVIKTTLDAADDIPGWSGLDEALRDSFVFSIVDIAYVILRWSQTAAITDDQILMLANAVATLTVAGFKLVAILKAQKAAPGPLAPLLDSETRTEAITSALEFLAPSE